MQIFSNPTQIANLPPKWWAKVLFASAAMIATILSPLTGQKRMSAKKTQLSLAGLTNILLEAGQYKNWMLETAINQETEYRIE